MSVSERAPHCPDAESIAALAEGRIDDDDLDAILLHVESCASCMRELELATRTMAEESFGRKRARMLRSGSFLPSAVV